MANHARHQNKRKFCLSFEFLRVYLYLSQFPEDRKVVFGFLFAKEVLSFNGYIGAALVLLSIIVSTSQKSNTKIADKRSVAGRFWYESPFHLGLFLSLKMQLNA